MLTQQMQEEFDRAARNPRRFLEEEFSEHGALYTPFFNANSFENAKIVLRFTGELSTAVHVEAWVQYKGGFYRASYLAF